MKDYIQDIDKAERRFFAKLPELRASEKDSRLIEGYGIVYNSYSQNFAPWMPGGLYEIIDPGAARKLLTDENIMILDNHMQERVLGRNMNTASLEENDGGVLYRVSAPNTSVGNDMMVNIELKNIRKSSFAFIPKTVVKETREMDGVGKVNVRRIVEFEQLLDFSPVSYPAYQETTAMKRSLDSFRKEYEAEKEKENNYQHKMRQIQHELVKIKLGIF